jgi:hypothetical protein
MASGTPRVNTLLPNDFRATTYAGRLRLVSCSRDPIGYEDGCSLYRAYFVPRGTDSFGLAIDSVNGSIEACMSLPNPAARIACLEDILTPETTTWIRPLIQAQNKLRRELINRTEFLRKCFRQKPPKQCTPKGKAWLEWYRKVAEEALEKYKILPKSPGVERGISEQMRRLKIIEKALKNCG